MPSVYRVVRVGLVILQSENEKVQRKKEKEKK